MIELLIWPVTVLVVATLAFIRTRPVSRKEIDALTVRVQAFEAMAAKIEPHLAELPPMYTLVRTIASDVVKLKPQKALFDNWDVLIGQFEDLKRVVETVKLKHLGKTLTGQGGEG